MKYIDNNNIKRHANGLMPLIENNKDIQRIEVNIIARICFAFRELKTIEKKLNRLGVKSCNIGLTIQDETREAKLLNLASEIADRIGLMAYHQSDPRGCSLYIGYDLNDVNYTNGIAVY